MTLQGGKGKVEGSCLTSNRVVCDEADDEVGGGTQATSRHPVQALYIQYTVRSNVLLAKRTTEEEGGAAGLKVLKVEMAPAVYFSEEWEARGGRGR